MCLLALQAMASERKTLFDNDWRFYRGCAKGAEQPFYNDAAWRTVDLPHDWSVEWLPEQIADSIIGPFSKASAGGFATGFVVGGEGWYRKSFIVAPEDAGKRHELYFEGIYNQSEIWINGKKAYHNIYGYTTFRFDITDYCKPAGEVNVIAVKVNNEGSNSRWYTGSGIYRHVWMVRTSKSHIEDWGTFIHTRSVEDNVANVLVSTTVINGKQHQDYTVKVAMLTADGTVVADGEQAVSVAVGSKKELPFDLRVKNPALWSPDSPTLYNVSISLWNGKDKEDEYIVPFGIRTIRFSMKKGFELNGVSMKLRGACLHHDNGLLGSAAFDRAEERKVMLLKQNGFNALRGSHNPMSESLMNACDRLGLLVIDEAFDQWNGKKNSHDYHLYFKEWSAKDIRNLVLRDRNRPSVIMWSVGNEIKERASLRGKETTEYLKKEIHKYDATRPVTAGLNKQWDKEHKNMISLEHGIYHLDIIGYNYMWRFYGDKHKKYPKKLMFGSESVAMEAQGNWDAVEKYPFVIGDFIWTAMDYLGEAGIGNALEIDPQENVHLFMDWPWFNGWCGDMDLLGVKKPASYYRDVIWHNRTISMGVERPVPEGKIKKVSFWGWKDEAMSWNFPGMEGKNLKVNVYTRAPKVRLYLNGEVVGEVKTDEKYSATFNVPYQPGTLKAVALKGKKELGIAEMKTIGEPVALRLTADRLQIKEGGQDLSYVMIEQVDKDGNVVMHSDRKVEITSWGDGGKVIASGTAHPQDLHSFQSMNPTLFGGRAMVIVRSGRETGKLTIRVKADGLKSSEVTINTVK